MPELKTETKSQTNNTLYEKKHHYMFILKELTILKNQVEHEVLNEGLPKIHAQEIQDMYNRTIVGLLEEGAVYQYIKDAKDPNKDIIKLNIDGSEYKCRNIDIREILEIRYDDVMKISYNGPTFKEIQKKKDKNKDLSVQNTSSQSSEDVKNLLLGIKDAINETNSIKDTENEKENNKDDIIKETYIPPQVYLAPSDERLIKKNDKGKKIKSLIANLIMIIILILMCVFAYNKIPGLKEAVEKNYKEIIQEQSTDTDTDAETVLDINNLEQ